MRKQTLHIAFFLSLLFIVLFSLQSFSQSLDWNVGIGGNSGRNSVSWALGPLVENGSEPNLYWEGGQVAPVATSPVIYGDNLIVTRRVTGNSSQESWIINYNVYTGDERWRVQLPVDTHHNYSKVSSVNNSHVYANRAGGASQPEYIYALDIDNGDIVWISDIKIGEHESESIAFAENGDLIAADLDHICRIDFEDGSTIWETPRNGASSDGDSPTVYRDRVYVWDQNSMGMFISTLDIESGELLYSSPIIGSPGFQQQCLTIGVNGTIYAGIMRGNDIDSLHSLTDNGETFIKNWSYPAGYTSYGYYGVSPYGSYVYAFSRNEELVSLDVNSGEVLNTSVKVGLNDGYGFSPYLAIGEDGMIYLAVEDWPDYKLSFFTPELELLWSESIYGLRGIALADSVLVVNGKSNIIRAYKGRYNPTADLIEMPEEKNIDVYPNPSSGIINIHSNFSNYNNEAKIEIINITGELVYSSKFLSESNTIIGVDISGLKNGIYILRYFIDNKYHLQKIIKQ